MSYKDRETLAHLSETLTDEKIAAMYGVTFSNISYWRHKFGIKPPLGRRKSAYDPSFKYPYDRGFFRTIDTREKAYILGFIMADGAIHASGRAVSIAIIEDDAVLLEAIRAAVGGTQPIGVQRRNGGYGSSKNLAVLRFCGAEMVNDLATHGVGLHKSETAVYPTLDATMESHFIRGVFDGNGHVGEKYMRLIGTHALLVGVQEAVTRHTGCALRLRCFRGYWHLTGSRRDKPVLDWLYRGATISLPRKQEKWQLYWS